MFLKVINFRRKEPREKVDLTRLLKYLFHIKPLPRSGATTDVKSEKSRLLGPPLLFHLVMTESARGEHIDDLAFDLSTQMHSYALEACVGRPLPNTWYTHIVMSFHTRDGVKLDAPQDRLKHRNPYLSRSMNAMRICIDLLKTFGCSMTQPALLVAHSDRRHIHVHAVVLLPVKGGSDWDILKHSRSFLYEWALINTKTFELTRPSKKVLDRNSDMKRLWEDLEALDRP